jgi:hypothetical protein
MSIAIVSVALADVCIDSGVTHPGYISMSIAGVILVAVMFSLVRLSLYTLRRVSEEDSPLEILEADDSSDYYSE